jgi:hypothetical protein
MHLGARDSATGAGTGDLEEMTGGGHHRRGAALFGRYSMAGNRYAQRQQQCRSNSGGVGCLVLSTVVLTVGIAPDVYLGWWCVPAYMLMFVCIPGAGIAARRRRLS